MRDTEWEVTREVLSVVREPYDVVRPYSTWESDDVSVDQDMVADD